MLFSSITFIYMFIPIVFILYFIVPKNYKNLILIISSLVFYFFGEPKYTLLLIISSISDFIHSLYIEKHRDTKKAKTALISSIIFNVALLAFFKYSDFFIGTLNSLFSLDMNLLHIPLPIGISFFTFQTMSYTIDVYRGKAQVQRNFITLLTYVCLFPQLVAGPIVRYSDIAKELTYKDLSINNVAIGIKRLVYGLSKKILVANVLAEFCQVYYNTDDKTILFTWAYAVFFSLQIYFDFSAYSDMAIGLGKILGFNFPENFNYPYISKSISEFWRRWHMSLGSWFRDYVYIPLGGNRVTKSRLIFNLTIVWGLTGLWHGASWNFVVWGLYFAVLLALEKMFLQKLLDKLPSLISHIYVVVLILISMVIFDNTSFEKLFTTLGTMFNLNGANFTSVETMYYIKSYIVVLLSSLVFATPLMKNIAIKLRENAISQNIINAVEPIVLGLLLIASTSFLIDGSFNPFLYFRF